MSLLVSKKRKLPLLLTTAEMQSLLEHLGQPHLFNVSRPVDHPTIAKDEFLAEYDEYITAIQNGKLPEEGSTFSAAIGSDLSHVDQQTLPDGRFLIRPNTPIIQMRRHHFIYTDKVLSGVMGENSIPWGIEFSYPQLYLDPDTQEIGKIDKSFPNTDLFHILVKWSRIHTLPTPLLTPQGKKNHPIRLGKKAFPFINNHPALVANNLKVAHGPS